MATATRSNARRRIRLAVACAVALTALTTATAAASMPPMEAPGPRARAATATSITGTGTPAPAFLLERGRYTGFDAPGAVQQTAAASINNRRQIVGNYVDGDGAYHGFLRDQRGRFHGYRWDRGRCRYTTIDLPGMDATSLRDINDRGKVLGVSVADLTAPSPALRGFVLDQGRVTSFDVPPGPITLATDINNRDQIVASGATGGVSEGSPFPTVRAFLLAKGVKGPLTPIAFPGAPNTLGGGLNDSGAVVGLYQNPNVPPGPQGSGMQPSGMTPTAAIAR